MAAETGFKIDGKLYEHPFHTWDLDDAQELFDRAGLTIEDWVITRDPETDKEEAQRISEKFRNPRVIRVLAAIAYWKEHKDVPFEEILKLVGPVRFVDIWESLAGDDADPPASTTEPVEQSQTSSVGQNASSGSDSQRSSDGQVVQLAPTTTSESDTSSISPPTSSVA